MGEPTDSRANNPVFRSLHAMSKERLVEYALDRRRENASLQQSTNMWEELARRVFALAEPRLSRDIVGVLRDQFNALAAAQEHTDECS